MPAPWERWAHSLSAAAPPWEANIAGHSCQRRHPGQYQPVTFANQLTFSGGYVAFSGSNSITFSNTLATDATTGTANLIVNAATKLDLPLGGPGSLVLFSGTSTLSLTEADSYGGATTVNSGTLIVTGAAGAITASAGFIRQPRRHPGSGDDPATMGAGRSPLSAASGLTLNGDTLTILGFNGSVISTEGFIAGVVLGVAISSSPSSLGPGATSSNFSPPTLSAIRGQRSISRPR